MRTRLAATAALLAMLTACGGGNGGDDELRLGFATADETQAFSSLGQDVMATTDEDGNLTEIRIGGKSFSGDEISDNNTNTDREDIAEMLRAVTAGEVAQDFVLDNETLNNAAFGLVADDQLAADAFAFGIPTPSQNVPTTGEATYSGRTIGTGTEGVTQFAFTGDVQINANFATGAISAGLSDFETQGVNGAAAPGIPDLSGTGFMTDGDYTVGLASEDTIGGVPEWLGSADGRLFGATGEETAGIWSAENDSQNIVVEGAFGASQF